MPEYVLNRNHTLRSTLGHTIQFEKGQPAYVPPALEREAVAIGAVRADGDTIDPLGAEKPAVEALSQDERENQMRLAFELLIEKNDSKDFTGQGVPTTKAIEKIVGFDVDRHEIAELWARVKAEAE